MKKNENFWQRAAGCGMAGAVFYIMHVVIGGILFEGYDHMSMPVSLLTAVGFEFALSMSVLAAASGALLFIFALSANRILCSLTKDKLILSGTGLLEFSMAAALIEYLFIPYDITVPFEHVKNLPHEIATFIAAATLVAAIYLIGAGLIKVGVSRRFGTYTVMCSGIVAFFGACTPFLIMLDSPIAGFIERIGMVTLYTWLFAASLYFMNIKKTV